MFKIRTDIGTGIRNRGEIFRDCTRTDSNNFLRTGPSLIAIVTCRGGGAKSPKTRCQIDGVAAEISEKIKMIGLERFGGLSPLGPSIPTFGDSIYFGAHRALSLDIPHTGAFVSFIIFSRSFSPYTNGSGCIVQISNAPCYSCSLRRIRRKSCVNGSWYYNIPRLGDLITDRLERTDTSDIAAACFYVHRNRLARGLPSLRVSVSTMR